MYVWMSVCMYMYVCMYVCMHIYVCMYACVCVFPCWLQAASPRMMAVPDIEDPFCPVPDTIWLPTLESCKASLVELLRRIPNMFAATRTIASAMGSAMKAVILGMCLYFSCFR